MKALAIVILLAATAHADPRAQAEKNFRAGERAYRAQNFEAAAQDFEEAYKAMPLPEIAFSAAQAHRRQYRVSQKPEDIARAMELYRVYLAAVKNGGRVRDAADAISELHREYEQLAAEGKLGKAAAAALTRLGVGVRFADQTERQALEEVDDESGAAAPPAIKVEALIDGNPVEPNAYKGVEPGVHAIHVSAPGYVPVDKKVNAIPASSDMVDIELQPKPAHVAVATEAGARISIDGRQLGVAPLGAIDVAPGKHLLTIAHDGRELAGRDLEVTRGQEVKVDVPLIATTRRRMVPWFVGAAGAATLLCGVEVGLAFYYQHEAHSDFSMLKPGDQSPDRLDSYRYDSDWRDRHVIGAWTMGGAALVIGATAAWLYYFDKPSSEGVRVTPTGIAGRF